MAKNPFNPTFGDVPKIYLDTDERAAKLVTTIKESDFARSFFITGVRGSGKTSFMTQVEHELNKGGWELTINFWFSNSKIRTMIFDRFKNRSP
ncbi:hypothetical protein HF82_11140, partial [Limosilactobacillus reuteri]